MSDTRPIHFADDDEHYSAHLACHAPEVWTKWWATAPCPGLPEADDLLVSDDGELLFTVNPWFLLAMTCAVCRKAALRRLEEEASTSGKAMFQRVEDLPLQRLGRGLREAAVYALGVGVGKGRLGGPGESAPDPAVVITEAAYGRRALTWSPEPRKPPWAPLEWAAEDWAVTVGDIFAGDFTNENIAAVFAVLAATPGNRYTIRTAHAERARSWLDWLWRGEGCLSDDSAAGDCVSHAVEFFGEAPLELLVGGRDETWPLAHVRIEGVQVEGIWDRGSDETQ